MPMPTWEQTHPDAEVPGEILALAGVRDMSEGNEGCPRFHVVTPLGELCIWVDYADPGKREAPDCKRFTLDYCDDEGTPLCMPYGQFMTDRVEDVILAVENEKSQYGKGDKDGIR